MRTLPVTVAALALLSTAAAAQMTPARDNPTIPGNTPPGATQAPIHREPAINPLAHDDVSKIDGTSVYGNDNSKIGHVSTVLMDPSSKKIDRLVVSAGGVLGVGSHRVAIPVDQFSWDADKGAFRLQTTVAELKAQPAWVDGATMTGSSTPPKTETAPASAGDNSSSK